MDARTQRQSVSTPAAVLDYSSSARRLLGDQRVSRAGLVYSLPKSRPTHHLQDIVVSKKRLNSSSENYARFYRQPAKLVPAALPATMPVGKTASKTVRRPQPIQTVAATELSTTPKKPKRSRSKKVANLAVVLAFAMSGLLGFTALQYQKALRKVEAVPEVAYATEDQTAVLGESTETEDVQQNEDLSRSKIDETKPAGAYKSADGSRPRKISIKKLGIAGYVQAVGVTKSGALAVPGNIWNVGWANNSAKPSEDKGVVVINGHVHGPTKPGIFYNLGKLAAGDQIVVTDVTGQTYTYVVVRSQTYKAGEANVDLYSSVSRDKQGLNLVTCTGKISGDHYEDRLVVFAEKI
ncbi:class F sortase [Candidatus Saccharibacteria bacterium]|jgi:LPXTG-site transpeptidase (sortase) family protein|nr:MAG: class F sortase [Candidatus Saccharibacteria bacterium]